MGRMSPLKKIVSAVGDGSRENERVRIGRKARKYRGITQII